MVKLKLMEATLIFLAILVTHAFVQKHLLSTYGDSGTALVVGTQPHTALRASSSPEA